MPLTRRRFCQLASSSVTAACLSRPLFAAAADPATASEPVLGFSLYGMKTLPLAEAVDHCARIGYRTIELALMPGYPTDLAKFAAPARQELRAQIAARGLSVSSLIANLNLLAAPAAQTGMIELIKSAGELAHQLDDRHPPILQTVLGGKPDAWDVVKEEMATRLRAWAAAAESADLTLSVKAHVMSAVNSPARLLWLHRRAAHPRVKLTYDYSHFQPAGLTLEATLRELAPQLNFIHVKDVDLQAPSTRFLLPGEGTIDYPAYFRLLRHLAYRGPVVVEVSSQIFNQPGYRPVVAAEQSYTILSTALEASRR